jgi:hypothetical protein
MAYRPLGDRCTQWLIGEVDRGTRQSLRRKYRLRIADSARAADRRLAVLLEHLAAAEIFRFEVKPGICSGTEDLQHVRQILGGTGGVKPDEPDRGVTSENRDHDIILVHRAHENVRAIALMEKGVELHFADAFGEFLGRCERPSGKSSDNGDVQNV